ncbi:MAG: polymorphic toxin-type HINT domain-containing protein [Pirellulales bacterium]
MHKASLGMVFVLTVFANAAAALSAGPFQDPIRAVIEPELNGKSNDRRLRKEEAQGTVSEARHWQAGQLQVDRKWIDANKLSEVQPSRVLQEYREQRQSLPENIESHMRLAAWCHEHGLQEQERAHWNAVLGLDPNHVIAHEKLHEVKIDDVWYSQDEIRMAQDQSRQCLADYRSWLPKIRNIAAKLASDQLSIQKKALAEVESIRDARAIESLEWTALRMNQEHALPLVKKITEFYGREACLSLLRIAITDPTSNCGQLAIEQLKKYPLDLFVPEALSLLSSPLQTESVLYRDPQGFLALRRLLFRETKHQRQYAELVKVLQTEERVNIHANVPATTQGSQSSSILNVEGGTRFQSPAIHFITASNLDHDQKRSRDLLTRQNQWNDQAMLRVFQVLERTTGQDLDESAEAWWNWWSHDYCFRDEGPKPARHQFAGIDYSQAVQTHQVLVTATYNFQNNPTNQSGNRRRVTPARTRNAHGNGYTFDPVAIARARDCFAAGTLVQTENGLREIEEIQVGDRVLAQSIETGELALKPVLQTSKTTPTSVLRVITDGGNWTSSYGHSCWVAGQGWERTARLQPGMHLRTAQGTEEIRSIETLSSEVPTYNLAVADFHTFFIGESLALTYDQTEVRGTLQKAPGYSDNQP